MAVLFPKLRDDLNFARQQWSDRVVYLLEDRTCGRFCHLKETEYQISQLCNGANDIVQIRQTANERLGVSLSQSNVERFIGKLGQLQLLECGSHQSEATNGSTEKLLHTRWRLIDPDRLLEHLVKPLGFLFTCEFLLFSIAFFFVGLVIALTNSAEISLGVQSMVNAEYILAWVFAILCVAFIHELSHGLACKKYGGDVHEIGVMMIYFMPAFYCNVSSAWRFEKKTERMMVTLAGPISSLLVWALAVLAWRFSMQGSWMNSAALLVIAVTGIECLFNLNPLIKLDGYYLLIDWLECPNLRQRSFEHLKQKLFGSTQPATNRLSPVQSANYLLYGSCAALYSFALVVTFTIFAGEFLVSEFRLLGLLFLLIIPFIVFRKSFGTFIALPFRFFSPNGNRNFKLPRGAITFLCLGLPIAGFCVYPWEVIVVSDVEIRAGRHAEIRAQIDGTIGEMFVCEGDTVQNDDPLFRVSNPTIEAELKTVKFEIEAIQSRLQQLLDGAPAEEVELANAKIKTAKQRFEYERKRLKIARSIKTESLNSSQAKIDLANVELIHAQKSHSRLEALFRNKAISASNLDSAESKVNACLAKLENEKATKRQLDANSFADLEESVVIAERELAEAEKRLSLITAKPSPAKLNEMQSQISGLKARYDYLLQQLNQSLVKAPFGGAITTKFLNRSIGRRVEQGKQVLEIENFERVELELLVAENEISLVREGQTVHFRAFAFRDRDFKGIVKSISPAAEHSSQNNHQSTFIVHTMIYNQDQLLRPGMKGKAKIATGKKYWGSLVAHQICKNINVEFWSWLPYL